MATSDSANSANSTWIGELAVEDTALAVTGTGGPGHPVVYLNGAGTRSARQRSVEGGERRARMTRFAVPLPLPGLAWDLLTDLEPILLTATEPRSHVVEVLDHAGAFESQDIESARTESARREHPPHRISLTVKGYAGPASARQQRRQYTVSVWASGLAKAWGRGGQRARHRWRRARGLLRAEPPRRTRRPGARVPATPG